MQEYLSLDTLQRLETTAKRMKDAGIENEELNTWHAYNKMKVNIVYQEQDMDLYNRAVEDLNKAKKQFNLFVQYRNEGLLASKPSRQMVALLDSAEAAIQRSRITAKKIGLVVENYQYDTGELLMNLDKLSTKLKDQRLYYNSITASAKPVGKGF